MQRTQAERATPSQRNVLRGAIFIMATSSIGPAFLTQTSLFTEKYLASFAFAILVSLLIDIGAQLNIWRIITVANLRGQDVANRVLPIIKRFTLGKGPDDLLPYLGVGEHHGKVSDLAYHNSLMVQLWSSLASRDTRLFAEALRAFPPKPTSTTWGVYVRCHDDIGWAITDEDAGALGLSGAAHRAFLSDFYDGSYPGSFARGVLFLVADEGGFITGSTLSINGGQHMY